MSKVIIKTVVDTGWLNGDYTEYHHIDKDEWESLTDSGKEGLLNSFARDALHYHCSSSAYVVEKEDD